MCNNIAHLHVYPEAHADVHLLQSTEYAPPPGVLQSATPKFVHCVLETGGSVRTMPGLRRRNRLVRITRDVKSGVVICYHCEMS